MTTPASPTIARTDRGSASIYAATATGVLAVMCVVALQVASLSRLQHTVTSAADLAAIAASQAAVRGQDGCAEARRIASRNNTELVRCDMAEEVATVAVTASSRHMWGKSWKVRRTARAAPSSYVQTD